MSPLVFLLATIFSICSDVSQDGRTFIPNNALYDAVPDLKDFPAIDSTHLKREINQINETLSFHNTYASDECTCAIPSNEGKIRPIQIPIDLKTSKSNQIQSIPFDDALYDAVPGSTPNAPAEAMDPTHLRGEINQINQTLSYPNTCASDECATPSSEAMCRMETRAPHTADNNVNPSLMMTFKRKRKKTNQGMMAMRTKVSDTCHVHQGRTKRRKERNQVFRTTASSPSATIITPSSIKTVSVRSTPIKKEKTRLYSRQTSFLSDFPSATSTHSLCLNCDVKFPAEFKFFSNDNLKTYFDEDVNGTGFKTNARQIGVYGVHFHLHAHTPSRSSPTIVTWSPSHYFGCSVSQSNQTTLALSPNEL